jgi:hypothetical protein
MKPIYLDPTQNLSYGNAVVSKIDHSSGLIILSAQDQHSNGNYTYSNSPYASLAANAMQNTMQSIYQSMNQQPYAGLYNWAPSFQKQSLKDYGEQFTTIAKQKLKTAQELYEVHGNMIDINYVNQEYLFKLNEMTHTWDFENQKCSNCNSNYWGCTENELSCDEIIIKDVIE